MMKILISGGTGLVGRKLVQRLQGKFSLRIISRSREKAHFADGMGVEVFYGDLKEEPFVHDAVRGVDCVVHLAAAFKATEALKANTVFMKNMITACRAGRVGKIIFMSSINSKFKKQGPYSLAKRICEEELSASGLDYCILRPTLIYDDNGGVFLRQLLKFMKRFRIAPVIGTGEYLMQPIHLDDVISITERVLSSRGNKAYDLVGPDIFTYNALAEMIFDKLVAKRRIKVHIPLGLLKLIGPLVNITNDKLLELSEDKTGDPEALRREFGIPLIRLNERLDIIMRSVH